MKSQKKLLFCKTANKNGIIHFENSQYTNNVKDGYNYCVNQINLLKNEKSFYIGATHDYNDRFLEHMEHKKMFNMFVLTQAQTICKSIKIEKKLIKRFGKLNKNLNKVDYDIKGNILNGGGGEGLIYDKNYIYVLFK